MFKIHFKKLIYNCFDFLNYYPIAMKVFLINPKDSNLTYFLKFILNLYFNFNHLF